MTLLGVGLGTLFGWLAIRGIDWAEVRRSLADFSPLLLAGAISALLASSYLRALRWRLLWTDVRVSALRLFWIENAALGLNNITPIRAMDEPLEFGILTLKDRLPGGTVIATMMMCRVQDLAFTILFILIALISLPPVRQFSLAIVPTALFFVGWLAVLLNLGRLVRRFPRLRRIPGVLSFEQAVNALWARKRRMAMVFLATVSYWLMLAPVGVLVAHGLAIDMPFHQIMVTVLGAIFFSTAVPGLPGAVGTFEFAMMSLMGLWGIDKQTALTFAIIVHTVLFLTPTAFTFVVLPWEGVTSIGRLNSLVERWRQAQLDKGTNTEP
ncbi:MAG: lysylphosphatidylglycerol synthase transmembrane domain-containing protein [Chloroflexota bacterium]|nr:lysylphosphatidylglycerol synthase transmembrane domain-containing protein [Chloroflexota bacterium]